MTSLDLTRQATPTSAGCPLIAPMELHARFPLDPSRLQVVAAGRSAATRVLQGADDRLLVVVGPCSIHDPVAALEYAYGLRALAEQLDDALVLIMRLYLEKPRTRLGWKGVIHDPHLDGSGDVRAGLELACKLAWQIVGLGLPLAGELLDPLLAPYVADFLSWVAIGARTSESQVHRELASGLAAPVGFKNGTDGDFQGAIDAIMSARASHTALGLGPDGRAMLRRTAGNPSAHLVLRGGRSGPNHLRCEEASQRLASEGLAGRVMVDCSHDNSGKQPARQPAVVEQVAEGLRAGSAAVAGVMLESHLEEGRQNLQPAVQLRYGQSITDACMGMDTTRTCLEVLAEAVRTRRRMSGGAGRFTASAAAPTRLSPR